MKYADDLKISSVLSGSGYTSLVQPATIRSGSPHSYVGRKAHCAIVLVCRADTPDEHMPHRDAHYSLRPDHLKILSGIDKRRKPVVCEDVRGNLLPNMVGRQ